MKRTLIAGAALGCALTVSPPVAEACGGFFCNAQPVDQQAERIVFAVGDGSTTMITQISYEGEASEFAWLLPVAEVPDPDSLGVFPAQALTALDTATAPMFFRPEDFECQVFPLNGGGPPESTPGVTVHIEETVGPYDVAVIDAADPAEVVAWLRGNGYRITDPMLPFVQPYLDAGMKLLALKLAPGSGVEDIEPFRMTLPGETPSIPLRMTALAAEPEMGFLVFVLGDQRFGPANWAELEIDTSRLSWAPHQFPAETNWHALIARAADTVGGHGWVTELASPTDVLADAVRSSPTSTPEQEEAQAELLALLEASPYLTRMYTRLSPEEMTVDPIFRRHAGGDIAQRRDLPRYLDSRDQCSWEEPTDACDFISCGAGASCREVQTEWSRPLAGCFCPPGTTGRTTRVPTGEAAVVCQDPTLSFLNPGDRETPESEPFPDPCVGFDCGEQGECIAVNLTPTCRCAPDAVAVGWESSGVRQTRCVDPGVVMPREMFDVDPPPPPPPPPGDAGTTTEPPTFAPGGGGHCSASGPPPRSSLAVIALALLVLVRRRRSS